MDELEILIQAILGLDITKSKQEILNELPKLKQQLQSDKNARINIIAGLDINKSKSLIQSQLNTLASQAKAPTIKVGVDVCGVSGSIGQVNQIAKSVNDSIKTQISGRNYASDNSAFIEQIKTLQDEKTAVDNLVKAFESYGIAIKNATSTKKLDENGNLSGLTIQVQSATGEVEKFEYAVQETSKQTSLVLENITATDSAVQRLNQSQAKLIQSQAKFNDQLKATSTKLESQLNNIKSHSSIGGKPIDFDKNEDLVAQWDKAYTAIKQVENANKTTMASMVADAEKEISTLQQMIKEFQNAEYAATSLRNKKPSEVKDTYKNELDGFINKINNSKVCIEDFSNGADNAITKLKTSCEKISDAKSLAEFLNQFDEAKSKFKSLESFYKCISQYDKELDKLTESWKKQGVYTDEVKAKIEELKGSLKNISIGNTDEMSKWVENFNDTISKINVDPERQKQLTKNLNEQIRLTNQILQKEKEIENIKNKPYNSSKISELNKIIDKRKEELSKLEQESATMTDLMSDEKQRQYILDNTSKALEELSIAQKNAADMEQRSYELTQKKATALEAQIKTYETINTKAVKYYKNELDSLKNDLEVAKSIGNPEEIDKIRARFTTLKTTIKAAGKEGQTFFQKMIDGAKKFSSWMSLTSIISAVVRDIRKMVTNVIELDSAMTNLKKVTDETETTYNRFFKNTAKQAKELHSTITDLIEQTSTWAKLGYNLSQSSVLAKASMIYSNVGEVDNEQAVTNIVTALKAFDIAAEDVMKIPDVYNKLGNEFAVSSKNLGSGMSQAATTMAMAGNNFNQVAAILTGAGEVLGDNKMDEIGNGMKTVTLRIQNQAGALKELGEEYEDLISVSKTQQQIFELTNGAVNIMQDADPNAFRSTYDILADVAEVIGKLNDTEASELIQLLFGKNRANVGTAVLKAFQSGQIQKAYEAAQNSAGSAQKEFDSWSESIEAHINTMKSSFESLSATVVDSDLVKGGVDFLTNITNGLDFVIDKLGVIPTLISAIILGTSLKNVGELNQNTPVYALSLTKCA